LCIELLNELSFLKDISDIATRDYPLFKNIIKEYQVIDLPEVKFRIAADWDGNWTCGSWYLNDKKITEPNQLIDYLPTEIAVKFYYHIDTIYIVSGWNKVKYLE